jgi:hypothetical protein
LSQPSLSRSKTGPTVLIRDQSKVRESSSNGEHLLPVGQRVAQQAQEVQQRLGQVALLDEPGEPGRRVLPLGDLALVDVAQQRQVGERRTLPAEPVEQQQVLGRRGDPLLAAHDVGDPHEVVVDDHGQVVGREPVGLEQHLVVRVRRRHLTAHEVDEAQRRVVRTSMRTTGEGEKPGSAARSASLLPWQSRS